MKSAAGDKTSSRSGHGGSSYKEDFFLPADYYKPVPLWISLIWVPVQWVILPILSYNPDLLDPLLSDRFEHVADEQKRNIIKLFMIMLWLNAIQCILAARQCRHRGLNAHTTLHWIINVGIHGFFSLRYLIWPDESLPHIKDRRGPYSRISATGGSSTSGSSAAAAAAAANSFMYPPGELSPAELITLSCGVLFFLAFFCAMYVEVKARNTVYQLICKFFYLNNDWSIEEYDRKRDLITSKKQKKKEEKSKKRSNQHSSSAGNTATSSSNTPVASTNHNPHHETAAANS